MEPARLCRRRAALLPAALLAAALACARGEVVAQRGRGWTVLVYMLADNDREGFAVANLAELAQVGSGDDLAIAAQIERAGRYSRQPIGAMAPPAAVAARRILVRREAYDDVTPSGVADADMGDPAALADFIAWGARSYPADRYALVLWGLGGGWQGGLGLGESRGGSTLTLDELASGVRAGLARANLTSLSLLGIDASLMASAEVAEELKGTADYLVASEELAPASGWDYRALAAAAQGGRGDALAIGQAAVDAYQARNAGEPTATLSVLDLRALPAFEAALARAGALASPGATASAAAVASARRAAVEVGRDADPARSFGQVDVGDLWARLAAAGGDWSAAGQEMAAALGQLVPYRKSGPGLASAAGVSVHFPATGDLYPEEARRAYAALAGLAPWRGFLEGYLGAVTESAPAVLFAASAAHGARVTAAAQGSPTAWVVTAPVASAAAAIATARMGYGLAFPTGALHGGPYAWIHGTQPATVAPDAVSSTWSGAILQLAQGGVSQLAHLSTRPQGDVNVGVVPLAYLPPDGGQPCDAARSVSWHIAITPAEIMASQHYYERIPGPLVHERTPAPGERLAPMALYVETSGQAFRCTDASFDAARPLDVTFSTPTAEALGSGSLHARFDVADPAGRRDFALVSWVP